MAITVPSRAPTKIARLERLEWERTFSDYLSADGWTVAAHFDGPAKGDGFTISATDVGSTWTFKLDTEKEALGFWRWQIWATHASDGRRLLESGTLELVAGFLEGGTDADGSTHASRMLALIEARIEDRLPRDAESYSIGGRSLSRIPMEELLELRRKYRIEVRVERKLARAGLTPGSKRRTLVSF